MTGHTARYDGCAWPMVGGATCIALGADDAYVTPTMARPGDRVVVTKGAAIEATALFAATFPRSARGRRGRRGRSAADALFEQMTVVPEARDRRRVRRSGTRGVTSMHDATEGGVLGGLLEVAVASEVGMRIELDAIPVRPEVRAVCDHVGIDPYTSITEGTLIATVVPSARDGYVEALADEGIDAAIVGDVTEPAEAGCLVRRRRRARRSSIPGLDPFWGAFGAWASEAGCRRVGSPAWTLITAWATSCSTSTCAHRALKRGGDVHGRVRLQPGGNSANAAVWAAWDGADARVHGARGRRPHRAACCAEALRDRGVKTPVDDRRRRGHRAMLVVVEAGERSMVADRGANARLTPDDLPASLDGGAVLVSGYLLLQEPTTPRRVSPRSSERMRRSLRWRRPRGRWSRRSASSGSSPRRPAPARTCCLPTNARSRS